jgi:hypothetical protein
VTQNETVFASTAYTITPVNNNFENGGSVTLNTACPNAQTLVLERVTPLTQTTVFTDNMPVPMKSFEYGLDKVTEIEQELTNDQRFSTVNLYDWTDVGVQNGYVPIWNSTTNKWTPGPQSGGAALTGAAFTGAVSSPKVNGVFAVDGNIYPLTGAGVASAISAALSAGGGIVDARGVCNATFSSELDIGNSSGTPITLLLPSAPNCAWTSTVNNGTSDGFKAFNNSHVVSEGQGSGGSFTFVGGGSFNGAVVFDANGITSPSCTVACGGYGYYRGFGVVLNGASGGTASTAVFRAIHYGDNSIFDSLEATYINPASYTVTVPHVAVVYDTCCNATFRNFQIEGQDGYTAADYGTQPLLIGDATNTWYTQHTVFDRINANHPGKGFYAVNFQGIYTQNIHMTSIYTEGGFNATDTTTPVIYVDGGIGNIDIDSIDANYLASGNTKYILSVNATSFNVQVRDLYSDSSSYCVNDPVNSVTIFPKYGNPYCYGISYSSVNSANPTPSLSNSAYGETAKSSIGGGYAATPSFGPDFYGGWWNTSTGPVQTKFGHLYCQSTQSNAGATIPAGRCTIQSAASGGAMTDVASFYGNGDVSFGSSPDTDCGPLCVNGVSIVPGVGANDVLQLNGSALIPYAVIPFGTTANTVAAGNDSRITGAAPTASPTFTGTVTMPLSTAGIVTTTSGGVVGSEAQVTVAQGGTGATTAPAALANLGGVALVPAADQNILTTNGKTKYGGYELCTSNNGLCAYSPPGSVVYNNQANTYSTGLQDFSAATMKFPLTATMSAGGTLTWPTSGTVATTGQIGTWGALNYPTWSSGTPFVKMTAAGTFALDTTAYATNTGSNWTISGQAIGDIPVASSTTAYGKLAAVAIGQVLISQGTGTAPAWSASPSLTTSLTTPTIYGGSAAASALSLVSTSSGAGSGDAVYIKGGNNGGTTIASFFGAGTYAGNVGIGTTGPISKLTVNGAISNGVTTATNSDNRGHITLSGGTGSYTFTQGPGTAGIWTTAPVCIIQDDTTLANLATSIKSVTNAALTITGSVGITDTYSYICWPGN